MPHQESQHEEPWGNLKLGCLLFGLTASMLFILDLSFYLDGGLECQSGNCLYFNLTEEKGCQNYLILENLNVGNYSCSACLDYSPQNGSLCFVPFGNEGFDRCPILQECDAPSLNTTTLIVNIFFGGILILNLLWLIGLVIKRQILERREYEQL